MEIIVAHSDSLHTPILARNSESAEGAARRGFWFERRKIHKTLQRAVYARHYAESLVGLALKRMKSSANNTA